VATDLSLSIANLRKGASFIIGARLEDDRYALHFDAVRKISGPSTLGDFRYEPVMFCSARRFRASARQQLTARAILLARVQGALPRGGIVYLGHDSARTGIRFGAALVAAENLLRDAERLQRSDTRPKLLLNDHCRICAFCDRCRDQAISEDNLSLLHGISEKRLKKYERKGLLTLTQLAHTFRPRRSGMRSEHSPKQRDYSLQALAIRDKTTYVLGTPIIPSGPVRIFLDLEGYPEEHFVYLIGMIVCVGDHEESFSFWANDKDQEKRIFQEFLAAVARYQSPCIFCYGSYERAFISRLRKHTRQKRQVDQVLNTLVNILSIIYQHFYFPTYSNGLKDTAAYLGFSWSDANASGLQSMVWRSEWEQTGGDQWKRRLLEYNFEDCQALRRVTDFLSNAHELAQSSNHRSCTEEQPRIESVQALDRLADTRRWGINGFSNPDFEFVNRRAYFDYQRERVFVRTHRPSKSRRVQRSPHQNAKLRPSRQIVFTATKCPACNGTDLESLKGTRVAGAYSRAKRVLDLVVTPQGIRRRIIECRAIGYRCSRCGHLFVPERYRRLAKHSHALMAWAIYQYVAHNLSLTPLKQMFWEFFGLTIGAQEVHEFKSLMARYYRSTYRKLVAKMVSGTLLHVDETRVKLREGNGYVWVFASLDEAIYVYKPTRHGDFLHKMLRDFGGVLISDFFAAYDSLMCPQQKCLVHLIREMNQEILNNPFDLELRSITQSFGKLLREIVSTVDNFGLRKQFLVRHSRDITAFFESVSQNSFYSEAAAALQARLIKNRTKLFTFTGHDNVPWNNNAAENAIKQFAYYREGTVGVMTERGLNDYLVLLSIYQTCRCKKVSFFKFLLSKHRDIDVFAAEKRVRRHVGIETYPKGYVPQHLTYLNKRVNANPELNLADNPVP